MKGGFLKEARPDDSVGKPGAGQKLWDQGEVDLTAKIFAEILDENNRLGRMDLERRVRTGTGVREFRGRCCGDPNADEPDSERDIASRMIIEHTKHASLCDMVAPVMEQAAEIFRRVQEKGKKDNMVMNAEDEIKVSRDIIKECLIRHALKCINSDNSGNYASGSHDAGLLATPQGYFGGDLESLDADTVRGVMERGYAYQDDFLDENTIDKVFNEMELLDFDGKLVEVQQQKMTGYRKDRIGWYTLEGLDREKQPGLQALFKKMISIPFELNKKCSLYLQAGGNFQLACYPTDAYYKKHVDGGYDDINNGRKITAIFYPNQSWSSGHGGHLKMFKRRPNPFQIAKAQKDGQPEPEQAEDVVEEEIAPKGGRLVLFRSRDMPHEVMAAHKKRYAVSLWLMGPPGPGDQADSHHTPT
mmetsp:Transcript_9853/g.25918  ORF Transcript_9853/g.25918 Transcript_9853/m.25918 type:complete len:416 (+) Transcript_9853:184-1431(+)